MRLLSSTVNTLAICGPSGVGKGTIIQAALARFPQQVALSVSDTTRLPRPGEIDGFHYHFIPPEKIAGLSSTQLNEKYLEYAQVHNSFYGTSFLSVESIHQQGKLCVLDIDSTGIKSIKKSGLPCKYLFIAPPAFDALEKRLRFRGTEREDQIQTRLKNAHKELEYGTKEDFDEVLVNDNLDSSVKQFFSLLAQWFPHLGLKETN